MKIIKNLIYIFLFVNTSLFAGIGGLGGGAINHMEKHEWNKLRNVVKSDKKLILQGTTAFIGNTVSVFTVCLTPEKVRTIKKVPIYRRVNVGNSQDTDGRNDGYMEVLVGKDYKEYPRNKNVLERKCNHKGKKCKNVQVTKVFDPVSTIKLKGKRYSSQTDFKALHQEDYHVPDCDNL
jgi:hypothetical protein